MQRELREKLHGILAAGEERRDDFEHLALRALAERLRQAVDRLAADEAETLFDARRRQKLAVHTRALIEQRQGVAHAAVRLLSEKAQSRLLARDPHLARDVGEPCCDLLDRDAPKVEALAARLDRCRHLVRLCRREDEDDMCRRLFERFQKRIECLRRQHVHFVDDVDLVAPFGGRELHLLAQVAHLVDAAVRCRVDLEDVERRAIGDLLTIFTGAAGSGRRPLLAVQRLRENLRRARLTRAARSGKEVGMTDASRGNCLGKRPRYSRLSHEILETARPPPAIESYISHDLPPFPTPPYPCILAKHKKKPPRKAETPHSSQPSFSTSGRGPQAPLRHMKRFAYRCFLPDLTGFTRLHCARPKRRAPSWKRLLPKRKENVETLIASFNFSIYTAMPSIAFRRLL